MADIIVVFEFSSKGPELSNMNMPPFFFQLMELGVNGQMQLPVMQLCVAVVQRPRKELAVSLTQEAEAWTVLETATGLLAALTSMTVMVN